MKCDPPQIVWQFKYEIKTILNLINKKQIYGFEYVKIRKKFKI